MCINSFVTEILSKCPETGSTVYSTVYYIFGQTAFILFRVVSHIWFLYILTIPQPDMPGGIFPKSDGFISHI